MPSNITDQVLVASATTAGEREQAAQMCAVKLGLHIPALVDEIDDRTEQAYTGWPDRLYLIDRAGMVAYKSNAGPFGFHPEELAGALQEAVGNPGATP